MTVDALDVDIAAGVALTFFQRGPARVAHGTGGHPRHARGGRRPGRVDRRGRVRRKRDLVRTELRPRDLEDDVRDALPDLGRGTVDFRASVRGQLDARRRVVVEPLRVADVLEADREPDAAPHALAARRVAGAAGKTERIA